MSSDTIADIITSIRNADMARKHAVRVASTNISQSIVKILLREGLIENARKHRENNKEFLVLTLRNKRNRKGSYRNRFNLKRISRLSLRIYSNYQGLPRILGGMGGCNSFYLLGYNDRSRGSIRKNRRRNFVLSMVILFGYFVIV